MSLKNIFTRSLDLVIRIRLRLGLRRSRGTAPRVLYAGMAPDPAAKSSGGAVKLLALSRIFPDGGSHGNILYLVTSALPKGALVWAQEAKRAGIKVVLNQNGVAYPAWAGKKVLSHVNERNRKLLQIADHVIYQSDFCRDACRIWVGEPKGTFSKVYNPVDTDIFFSTTAPRAMDLLLMGSSAQAERVKVPLEAMAKAKEAGINWRLRIAGKLHWAGAEKDLSSWIEDLGLVGQVEWVGSYRQEEAPDLYRSAKVLVHMQDKDASPTVPLEALACGTPVVGIKTGGVPELVPPGRGVLLPVKETWESFCYPTATEVFDAIVEAMTLSAPPEQSKDYISEKFSSENFLAEHRKIFGALLE